MTHRPNATVRRWHQRHVDEIEAMLNGPYGPKIRNLTYQLYQEHNTWHTHNYLGCLHDPANTQPSSIPMYRYQAEVTGKLCTNCYTGGHLELRNRRPNWRQAGYTPSATDWYFEARALHTWQQKAAELTKTPKNDTASVNERRRAAAERLQRAAEDGITGRPEAATQWEALAKIAEDELARVAKTTKDSTHQAKILTWVRRDLLPQQLKHLDPEKFSLDETPTLVGITPYLPQQQNQKVRALVEAFAIRRNDHTSVLVVPRYVYDHLQRSPIGRLSGTVLLQGAPAPAPHIAETAAGLWNPEGTTDLASISDAIAAATILHDLETK